MTELDVIIDGKNTSVTNVKYCENFTGSGYKPIMCVEHYKRDEFGQIVIKDGEPVLELERNFKIKSIKIELERE